jgi:hypothetical protein
MDPLTERVFEDKSWLVILMAVIAFFWFHHRNKERSGQWSKAAGKTRENSQATQAPKGRPDRLA